MPAVGRQSASTPWFSHNILDLGNPSCPFRLDSSFDPPNQAPTIRAAMDWLNENHPNETVVLRFPQGSYHCHSLIRAAADEKIAWQGHPAGTELYREFPHGEPCVWHGFGREVLDGPTYWRDTTSGVYDASVPAGSRYGLALPRRACAGWFSGGGFEWWDGASYGALCVSIFFRIEDYATYTPAVMNLCSLGDPQWEEGVFVLQVTPVNSQINIFIHSRDGSARYDVDNLVVADWGGLHRIDFQWDKTGALSAWWDDQPVTATPKAAWSPAPRAATGVLRQNNRFPFLVNSAGAYLRLEDNAAQYAPATLAVYGLHVSRAPRFAAGVPITATDSARYFSPDGQTAGLLPLTDPPPAAGTKADPFWRVSTGAGESVWGVVCPPPVNGNAGWYSPTFEVSRGSVSGISFRAYRTPYMAAQILDATYDGCGFVSTSGSGFGQYEVGSSYVVHFDGCVFASSGRDGLQLADALAIVSDCIWPAGANSACNIRAISSELELRSPKIYNAVTGLYAIECWKGRYTQPITTIDHCMIDNEVNLSPLVAIVVQDAGGRLIITNSDLGGAAAGAVSVDLLATTAVGPTAPTPQVSYFLSRNCHNRASGGFVRVNGPDWYGDIIDLDGWNTADIGAVLTRAEAGVDDVGGVVVRDRTGFAPRQGEWVAGCAEIGWAAARPGMVRRWACARSGDDHAADADQKPQWEAVEVVPGAAGAGSAHGWDVHGGGVL